MNTVNLTPEQRQAWAGNFCRNAITLMRNSGVLRKAQVDNPLICVAWPREDRVIILVNPYVVNQAKVLAPKFKHDLKTVMRGHETVISNSRGIYFQIGYVPMGLDEGKVPNMAMLDLATVPDDGDLMVPLGEGRRGPKWISLLDADSVLIGGTRQMGKTTFIHSWMLPLLEKEDWSKLWIVMCDGKSGVEFGRYANIPCCQVAQTAEDLLALNGRLLEEIQERSRILGEHNRFGARHIKELPVDERPPYILIVIDELANVLDTDGVDNMLRFLISVGGAYGVIPILATQRPDNSQVAGFLKANLATRICLPVPTHHDSSVVLGFAGAEKLSKTKGRVLTTWEGALLETQAYNVPTTLLNATLTRLTGGEVLAAPGESKIEPLDNRERRLVETAIEKLEGRFHVRELSKLTSISRRFIEGLAQRWEAMGLLTPPSSDRGTKTPRTVTESLRKLAGIA